MHELTAYADYRSADDMRYWRVKQTEVHGGTTEFLIEMVFRVIAG